MMHARSLKILWLLAFVSVSLCAYAIWRERDVRVQEDLGLLLPELIGRLADVQSIEITHGLGMGGSQTIRLERQNNMWRLPQRANFPANQELVNETLLGLAEVHKRAARTALPEWHAQLGLTDPENLGAAIRFRLLDQHGAVIAEVLLGEAERSEAEIVQKVTDIGRPQENFYIRRATENQTWLARGRLPRSKNMGAWIDPQLPLPPAQDVVGLRYHGAVNLSFERPTAEAGWPKPAQELLDRVMGLRPGDVAPATEIDFSNAQQITLTMANGDDHVIRAVSMQTEYFIQIDDGAWAYKLTGEARSALYPILSN